MADISKNLTNLEQSAQVKRAKPAVLTGDEYDEQWRTWHQASELVQAAIIKHADESGEGRYEVEQAVKRAARHAQEDPAVE
ncbi:hypothetical protein [Streptomyces sp. NPDC001816]|uniref:hypothetical protein n=1 Tax=Streptomyces sp. NPDC001816 TaxID=3364612 RepID=UPI0036A74978